MSPFKQRVIDVVNQIPYGKVVSYGQVAAYVGVPRGARQVGWVLRQIEESVKLPWWRVINNTGRISIDGNLYSDKHLQKKLLEQEGIQIQEDFKLDIDHYRFIATDEQLKKFALEEEYINMLHGKYFAK